MHVELESVDVEDLVMPAPRPTPQQTSLADSVVTARARQCARYGMLNSEVSDGDIREHTTITGTARELLTHAIKRLGMSARGYVRVLRVARTIADLALVDEINEEIIAEAISYRSLDRLSNVVHGGQAFRKVG
jgi:magnesium chelatase family protein